MRVAVVGAGLFGCTAAIHAARAGNDVTLFDKASDIMTGATKVNQLRLHRGYHYPRSDKTVKECRDSMDSFLREYGAAVMGGEQYYAIARGSKVSASAYVDFMDYHGLEYELVNGRTDLFNHALLEAAFRVEESRISYPVLRKMVRKQLDMLDVKWANGDIYELDRACFDKIIVAAYAGTNEVLRRLGCAPMQMQYEFVEKPVVRLPEEYRNVGVVVMDGPFGCIDPGGIGIDVHQMGHVEYAVRNRWNGVSSEMGYWYERTNFNKMQGALGEYLPFVRKAEWLKSNYVTRVVLPNVDDTDERPTLVRRIDEQVLMIFSGKLGHAVRAAEDSLMMLEQKVAARRSSKGGAVSGALAK